MDWLWNDLIQIGALAVIWGVFFWFYDVQIERRKRK